MWHEDLKPTISWLSCTQMALSNITLINISLKRVMTRSCKLTTKKRNHTLLLLPRLARPARKYIYQDITMLNKQF